ncbi:hypothetical protein AVEN_25746-1 [Araneus ventricosus]|uniref:Uncharacterized protein n=1 Tax=Araneus ventricosus TaxID=182803 RepID=A0A4Y2NK20_ARAVE|nr:hypothetical protein AVEN_25746-1 [Araneus ventricosus]
MLYFDVLCTLMFIKLKLFPIPQGSDRPCAWCRRGVGGSFAAMFVLSALARAVCRSIGHSDSPYAMAGRGVFLCVQLMSLFSVADAFVKVGNSTQSDGNVALQLMSRFIVARRPCHVTWKGMGSFT